MKRLWAAFVGAVIATMTFGGLAAEADEPVIGKTYAQSKPGTAPVLPVAKGKSSIIWIMLDDVGYGASSTFRGGARTAFWSGSAKKDTVT